MNEVSNFCKGECNRRVSATKSNYEDLPYLPGNRPLDEMSLSVDATHYKGLLEYDVHNYFGLL